MMRFPLRGGNWNNGSNAGLGYLNLNNSRANSNSNIGYRIYSSHRLLRKCSVKRIKAKLKKYHRRFAAGQMSLHEINPKLQSWFGHASHANTANLRKSLFEKPFRRDS